jgi:ABC-type glutathione transport system ATPase component
MLLKAENLSKEFSVAGGILRRRIGTVQALRRVSFELHEGESLGLAGESGSGKTTLGRILCRFLTPDQGRLWWDGRPAESFSRREWATRVQMIFQDPAASLNPKLSVHTLLSEAILSRARLAGQERPSKTDVHRRMKEHLSAVGLPTDIFFYYPHQFSGGQKQRLAIARALAMEPRLLVADEPVSALDLSIQAQILNLLMDLKERFHLTTVVVSHDLAVLSHLADRILVMKAGEVVEAGATSQILSSPKHPYTRSLVDAVPALLR